MNRLTGSRFYSVLITITDYILLGILWLVTSLPILTIGVTSSAVLSILHQWDKSSTGSIFGSYFRAVRHQLLASFLNGLFYVLVLGTISFLFNTIEIAIPVAIGLILAFVMSTMLFLNLTLAIVLSKHHQFHFGKIFEKSVQAIFLNLLPNLLSVVIIYLSYVLVSLFPPMLFIFAGGIWKILYQIISRRIT